MGKADADIDNDGDVDKSDKYLHNRRKAIGKAMKKESSCGKMRKEDKVKCPKCEGKGCSHCGDTGYHMKEGKWNYPKDMTSKTNKDDDNYLGGLISSRKKEARKAHRKAMKARAHKELMRGTRKEEVEQVDELKKSTLANYRMRASSNKLMHKIDAQELEKKSKKNHPKSVKKAIQDLASKQRSKADKREKGIELARKKLRGGAKVGGTDVTPKQLHNMRMKAIKKEDVEHLDELKKSTLASYIKKASRSRSASASLAKDFDNQSYRPLKKMNRHSPNITGYYNKKGQEKKKSPKKFDKAKSEYDTLKKLHKTFDDQAQRRQKGIDRAASKLAKEEVNIFSEREMQAMIDAGVFEATRADHYKSATPVETMKDKYKGDAADEMAKDHNAHSVKHADITPEEIGHNDAVKAGKATKQSAPRGSADKLSSGAPKTPEKVKKVK